MATRITRVAEYDGRESIVVAATQLESTTLTRNEARRILDEWLEFFATPSPVRHLELASRVPQQLLDAAACQTQLLSLTVKWGPYSDLSAIAGLPLLRELRLRGATKVVDLSPLTALLSLELLELDQVVSVSDPSPLSSMTNLASLAFGNAYMGSEALVKVDDLEWLRPLVSLRTAELLHVKLARPDLSPLLDLPQLERVNLSMRREYRDQVRDFATRSRAFAALQAEFESRERLIARVRAEGAA